MTGDSSTWKGGVERVKHVLRRELWKRKVTFRELDRRLGRSVNYHSQMMRGKFQLTVAHVFQILEVAGIPERELFAALYREAGGSEVRGPQGPALVLDSEKALEMVELIRLAGEAARDLQQAAVREEKGEREESDKRGPGG